MTKSIDERLREMAHAVWVKFCDDEDKEPETLIFQALQQVRNDALDEAEKAAESFSHTESTDADGIARHIVRAIRKLKSEGGES